MASRSLRVDIARDIAKPPSIRRRCVLDPADVVDVGDDALTEAGDGGIIGGAARRHVDDLATRAGPPACNEQVHLDPLMHVAVGRRRRVVADGGGGWTQSASA